MPVPLLENAHCGWALAPMAEAVVSSLMLGGSLGTDRQTGLVPVTALVPSGLPWLPWYLALSKMNFSWSQEASHSSVSIRWCKRKGSTPWTRGRVQWIQKDERGGEGRWRGGRGTCIAEVM